MCGERFGVDISFSEGPVFDCVVSGDFGDDAGCADAFEKRVSFGFDNEDHF